MSKALLLLAWIPFLIFPYHADPSTTQYVKVTCDNAWVLMDIVKNNDTISWKQKDPLLLDIREEVISECNRHYQ
jgi:hypothetical protein